MGFIFLAVALVGCAPLATVRDDAGGPRIQLEVSKTKIEPGHVLRIKAQGGAPGQSLQVYGWGHAAVLSSVPGEPGVAEGFLAVPLETNPGIEKLQILPTGPGGHVSLALPVAVIERREDATVRIRIKNFSDLPYAAESLSLAEARGRAGHNPAPRFEPWPWPVLGRLSERFGVKRIYNNGEGAWRHGGYDIAAPGGTPVLSPAEGWVLWTAQLKAHGNTVLVDHGYGVVTTYLHLRTILVRMGDHLARGQALGEVGSTGGSTADHLHFQVNVQGVPVDPGDFLMEPQTSPKNTR